MKWAVVVLVAVVAGCEYRWVPDEFPVRVYVSSNVSDEDLEKVVDGAEMWNTALGEKVFRVVSGNGRAKGRGQVVVIDGRVGGGALAQATVGLKGCTVVLGDMHHPQNDHTTIAHELGHCLLAEGHDTDPTSLMYWEYKRNQEIKPEHVEAIRDLMD